MENESKSPLASTTLQAAFVTALLEQYYPPVGTWLTAHNTEVMGALGAVVAYGRHTATQPLDWKNWTLGGFGFKF